MNTEVLLSLVHDNPESTILIEHRMPKKIVRIDVGKHENFDVKTGETYSEVSISGEEKERSKRRKDLKLQLSQAGIDSVHQVYTISRVNENQEDDLDVKEVEREQRSRKSPGK
jgi:hypothetical protein